MKKKGGNQSFKRKHNNLTEPRKGEFGISMEGRVLEWRSCSSSESGGSEGEQGGWWQFYLVKVQRPHLIFILWQRKPKPREVQWPVQGHLTQGQSQVWYQVTALLPHSILSPLIFTSLQPHFCFLSTLSNCLLDIVDGCGKEQRQEKNNKSKFNLDEKQFKCLIGWKKIKNRWCSSLPGIFKWASGCYFVFKMKNVEVFVCKDTSQHARCRGYMKKSNLDRREHWCRFQLHSCYLHRLM